MKKIQEFFTFILGVCFAIFWGFVLFVLQFVLPVIIFGGLYKLIWGE